jgi:hypothetical protein
MGRREAHGFDAGQFDGDGPAYGLSRPQAAFTIMRETDGAPTSIAAH